MRIRRQDETHTDEIPTQDRLALGHIKLDTVASRDNCSDLLTKILSKSDIQRLMKPTNHKFRERRASAAKRVLVGDGNESNAGHLNDCDQMIGQHCANLW